MNEKVKLVVKNEQDKVEIHGLSHDGRGIANIGNKTTFISGALPGEKVTYHLTQKKRTYNEAETLEILRPAETRQTPPCPHFGICGGCNLQHLNTETQLQLKEQTLLEQFKHFGQVTPHSILSPLTGENIGYRRKARLGVKFVIKKNKMLVGFREKSSNYLADLEQCVVLHPRIGKHLLTLANFLTTLEAARHIPQIEIAIGDTEVALVVRHLILLSVEDKAKLKIFAEQHSFHIYLQPNSPEKVTKLWPEDNNERLKYTLPQYQLEFLFHPLDFTQINLEMNRLMVERAINLLDLKNHETVLDLFCGIGNFTLPLARFAKEVTGIEGSIDMIERAQDNAKHNNIQNVNFYAANLQAMLSNASWLKASYDKILLDPPRAGAKELLPYLEPLAAKKIVYVSCNPATLARDAGELVHQYGYQLTQAGIMNMFPHTSHIEAIAVFEKT